MTEDPGALLGDLGDPFRVAEWEIDVASHRMRRGGETVKLEPRTMAVLVYLAAHAGQVVTREELEREVWAGRVVGYEALSSAIAKLRRAFEDEPRQPRIIETVPKAGYRLLAEVERMPEQPGPEQAGPGDPQAPDASRAEGDRPSTVVRGTPPGKLVGRRLQLLAVGGLAFVLLAAAVAIWLWRWHPTAPPDPSADVVGRPSVAVLPFDNLSADRGQDFFADGLTSDLITDLSRISGLFVIARHSVFAYEDPSKPVTEIADELGVRFVVEGSVRRADGRIRINAQLVDGATGMNVWSERYERDEMEVFVLQDEVITDIIDTLAVKLTESERVQLARHGTDDLEAYDYYLRAEHRWLSCIDIGCEGEVIALYRQAIALDPGFVDAYAGIAKAALATWRWNSSNVMPGAAARRLAYDAASKVLSLDASDPRAYSVLATIQTIEARHEQALQSARSAVRLDPNSADAHSTLAWILMVAGRHEEAQSEMEAALRHNPKPPAWYHAQLGMIEFLRHDYEMAIALISEASEFYEYRLWIAMAYAELGQLDEARSRMEPVYTDTPFANLGYYRALFAHYRREQDLEHVLGALEKAGIPQWPYGFEPPSGHQLDEAALREITFGHTWTGTDFRGNRFVQELTADGRVAFRGHASLLTGKFYLDEDRLCIDFPSTLLGRDDCGYVYENPGGTPANQNEYVRVSIGDIYYFSISTRQGSDHSDISTASRFGGPHARGGLEASANGRPGFCSRKFRGPLSRSATSSGMPMEGHSARNSNARVEIAHG